MRVQRQARENSPDQGRVDTIVCRSVVKGVKEIKGAERVCV